MTSSNQIAARISELEREKAEALEALTERTRREAALRAEVDKRESEIAFLSQKKRAAQVDEMIEAANVQANLNREAAVAVFAALDAFAKQIAAGLPDVLQTIVATHERQKSIASTAIDLAEQAGWRKVEGDPVAQRQIDDQARQAGRHTASQIMAAWSQDVVMMLYVNQSQTDADRKIRQAVAFAFTGKMYDPPRDFVPPQRHQIEWV